MRLAIWVLAVSPEITIELDYPKTISRLGRNKYTNNSNQMVPTGGLPRVHSVSVTFGPDYIEIVISPRRAVKQNNLRK